VNPKRVPDSAMTRSDTAHRPMPPPRASPCTRAITGAGHVSIASNISAMAMASCSFASVSRCSAARIHDTSAPAQNDGPSPARTTPRSRGAGSRASAANVDRSSAIVDASNALCASGRVSVTRAIASPGPLRSIRTRPATSGIVRGAQTDVTVTDRRRASWMPVVPPRMLLGIDHIVIAVRDPDRAAELITAEVGLEAGGGGRHPRSGTFNRLIWLGDAYLELMGVSDPDLARGQGVGAVTLQLLEHGREGFASFAIASDALAADLQTLRSHGAPYRDARPGERERPDGEVVRWATSLPDHAGPDGLPFLIEHRYEGSEWGADARADRAEVVHPFRRQGRPGAS